MVFLSGLLAVASLLCVWYAQPRYNAQANRELIDVVDGFAGSASVRTVIAKGANPNARDGMGTSLSVTFPLWIRAISPLNPSDARSARRELSWKPATSLWRAASRKAIDCVEDLLAAGANPDLPSYYGETPLHLVASVAMGNRMGDRNSTTGEKALSLSRLLLEKGANPNAQDFDGRTPLMVAVYSHAPASLVKLLLEKGADPDLKMDTGACARDFVNGGTDPEVAKLLTPEPRTASVVP